jgi:hypothetical protein
MKTFTLILLYAVLLLCFTSCHTRTAEGARKDAATKPDGPKRYILEKAADNADFNYGRLHDIDSPVVDTRTVKQMMAAFEPVAGRHKYYRFIATYTGEAYNADGPPLKKTFHDILIVKTDPDNTIIDAYQYTLEWAEPPLKHDLFGNPAQHITLSDAMDISVLKLTRIHQMGEPEALEENGIVRLK